MGKLEGKVALITGGGSGIGKATAILFASEGAKVIVADCVAEGAEETVRIIKAAGGEAAFVKADVSQAANVEKMVNTTILTYGQLDILFNNAGVQPPLASTVDTSEEAWDRVININLKGVFLGMKYGIPHMLDRGGVVINTASAAGLVGFPHQSAYGASKGGVIELTKTAALEFAGQNIRVNCICPGLTQTPLADRVSNSPEWATLKPLRSPRAMGRSGMPEEIAQAALFLASDQLSSYITGTALIVDGGYTAL